MIRKVFCGTKERTSLKTFFLILCLTCVSFSVGTWLITPFGFAMPMGWIVHPICCVINSFQPLCVVTVVWFARQQSYWIIWLLAVTAASISECIMSSFFPLIWTATNPTLLLAKTPLVQWLSLVPAYLFSAVLYSILFLLIPRWDLRGISRLASSLGGIVLLGAFWLGGDAVRKSVKVNALPFVALIVQPHIKPNSSQEWEPWLKLYDLTEIELAKGSPPDLVLWPESSLFPSNRVPIKKRDSSPKWREDARSKLDLAALRDLYVGRCNVLAGSVLFAQENSTKFGVTVLNRRDTVSGCLVRYDGAIQIHDKLSLLPFRECRPWCLGFYWKDSLSDANQFRSFSPGKEFNHFTFLDNTGAERRIAVVICYESWQPWLPQYHTKGKVDAICHLSYDADFWQYPAYHDRMLRVVRLRAIETRTWQLLCNYWSGSAVIDPTGSVVMMLPSESGILRY